MIQTAFCFPFAGVTMTSQHRGEERFFERRLRALLLGMVCIAAASTAMAKEVTLTAIELYDGPTGATYVLLNGVTINGKTEMRACRPCQASPIDKLTYSKLEKFQLAPGGKLERAADGVLRWTATEGGEAVIVAPLNVKYENKPALSSSELADQATLKGAPAGATGEAAPAPGLAPGVVLVFVAAPDVELAEYLRARRASDIRGWQDYLGKYPSSPHLADAKLRLAVLLAAAGESALADYKKQPVNDTTDYAGLKSAKSLYDQAKSLSPGAAGLTGLDGGIKSALGDIADRGRVELEAYRSALKDHSPGYLHLAAARKYAEFAEGIQTTPKGSALQGDVDQDSNTVQVAMHQAESAAVAKQYEQAMVFLGPYRPFAGEEPRIAAIIDSGYAYHVEKGKTNSDTATWPTAISEFEKADAIKDTPEVRDLLSNARAQQVMIEDKQAAAKALADSQEYEQSKDIIHAYETLDDLPLAQRRLVTDSIERLKPEYVLRSSQLAKELRAAHRQIRGLSDEIGIDTAYIYLLRAYKLSENEAFKDQMDVLSDDLSAYLLTQAKHYLDKPSGSGTEIGWTYLTEALAYKANNLDAVRDAMFSATQAHAFRSKISIKVQFRDQTSQRDSPGFSAQLGDAVIAGLESSKIPVKVVRAGEVTPVEPDYLLEGDVLHHHLTVVPVVEAMESKYSPTTREVPNEDWNKANRAYEKATMELQTAQQALQGAETKGNKSEVKELGQTIKEAEKAVEDAHVVLDSTPKTRTEDVIRPYSYARKTVTLTGSIHLQFRIADSFADEQGEIVPITQEDHKSYVVLENVKAEDTEGVKAVGTEIDQNEFMTAQEAAAVDALKVAVRKRVEALPGKIYDTAKSREAGSDLDGAAEAYLRFLEVSPPDPKSPEQQHARQFLKDQFNMEPVSSVAP
jgi:hypothetical protein